MYLLYKIHVLRDLSNQSYKKFYKMGGYLNYQIIWTSKNADMYLIRVFVDKPLKKS